MKNLLMGLLVVLALSGCAITEKTDGLVTIEAIGVENEEYAVLKAAGVKHSMIFAIDIGSAEVREIEYWMDHYVDGEQVDSLLALKSLRSDETDENKYQLYFSTNGIQAGEELWTLSLRNNKNVVSGKQQQAQSEHDATMVHMIQKSITGLNDITDLGLLVRGSGSVNAGDDIARTIAENDEVFVIRCKFINS